MIARMKPYRGFTLTREIPNGWLTFYAIKNGKKVLREKSASELRAAIDRHLAAELVK